MGLIADTIKAMLPSRTTAIGATIPTWADGNPQQQRESYYQYSLEGYSRNEIAFACVEMLATSAAEPRLAAYQKTSKKPERIENTPLLDLMEAPNPFMDRFQFWASVMMYRAIAGNAYIEKVRSRSGQVVELWLLRPDRVRVVPAANTYIRGYQYQIAEYTDFIPAQNVIHIKTRNPLDDFHGLPPLAVAAGRVDTDNWMRQFTSSFFQNAGVPSGLLNIMRTTTEQEREMIQQRFRSQYGGAAGWHRMLVIDGEAATYQQMGMPLGERGLVMPELDAISESRICACFGVRPSLIGAKIAAGGSSLAGGNRRADREAFWDETLIPIYRELAAALTTGLVPEFDGLDYVEFDLSDVSALQEDQDAKHDRVRKDVQAGMMTREEGRVELGLEAEPDPKQTWILPANLLPQPVTEEPGSQGGGVGLNEGSSRSLSTLLANITRLQQLGETDAANQLAALLGDQFGLTVAQAQAQLAAGGAPPATNGRVPALNGATNGRAN